MARTHFKNFFEYEDSFLAVLFDGSCDKMYRDIHREAKPTNSASEWIYSRKEFLK